MVLFFPSPSVAAQTSANLQSWDRIITSRAKEAGVPKENVFKRATTIPIHIQPLSIMGMTIELGPQEWLIMVFSFKQKALLFFQGFFLYVCLFVNCRSLRLIIIRKYTSLTNHNSCSFSFRWQTKVTVDVWIFNR